MANLAWIQGPWRNSAHLMRALVHQHDLGPDPSGSNLKFVTMLGQG